MVSCKAFTGFPKTGPTFGCGHAFVQRPDRAGPLMPKPIPLQAARQARRSRRQIGAIGPSAMLIAGPTASGKSALAIRPRATAGRRRHQLRFDAGLSGSAHRHGKAKPRGRGRGAPSPVRTCRCRPQLVGRPLAERRGRRDRTDTRARSRPDPRGWDGTLFQGADARPLRDAACPRGGAREDSRDGARHCRSWSCIGRLRRGPARRRQASAERSPTHPSRPGNPRGDRALAFRVARRAAPGTASRHGGLRRPLSRA